MEPRSEPATTVWPFPFTPQDWEQTPPAVQAYLRTVRDELGQLHNHVETLEARLKQNSTTSSRPPSADSPYKKPQRRTTSTTPRKAGGKPGHPGHRQGLLAPTHVVEVQPAPCVCGNTTFAGTSPYYTHQVIELPPIAMEVTHWVLHQGWCQVCGRWRQAHVPAEHATGYGPRFSALMGELAGTYGNGCLHLHEGIALQRHLQNMLFYHRGLLVHKKLISFVTCARKAMTLHVRIWSGPLCST